MNNERLKATDSSPTWRSKSGNIKIEDMDEKHLQNALNYSYERETFFFNRALVFTNKINQILEEADRRGIKLKQRNDNILLKLWHMLYFKNKVKRKLKEQTV